MSSAANDPTKYRTKWLLWAAMMTLSTAWASGLDDRPGASLPPARAHVHVYDYTPVPARVLAQAEEQVDMILRHAGVLVTWKNSTPPKDASKAKPTSPLPAEAGGVDLRIVPRFAPTAGFLRYSSMGFAVPPVTASISWEWVDKLASLGTAEEYQVLGAAMTHEIGHLFLGTNSDSRLGIMCGRWKEDDLVKVSHAHLTFTPDEARRIRAEVCRRQKQPVSAPWNEVAQLPPLPAAGQP